MFVTIHTFKLNLEIWVGYILDTLHKKYASSQKYSQETLFIPIIFLEITFHHMSVVENIDNVHNILTIHYSCRHHFIPISNSKVLFTMHVHPNLDNITLVNRTP